MKILERWRKALVKPEIHVFSSSWIDEVWIRSLAERLAANPEIGLTMLIAGDESTWPHDVSARYRRRGIRLQSIGSEGQLQLLRCRLVVSASSGLQRAMFGPSLQHLVHMPHSLASLHAIYPDGCFDGYDTLFAAGPHHAAEFQAIRTSKGALPGRVFKVGYGKLDLLPATTQATDGQGGKTVLLAPSWGEHNILNSVGVSAIHELLAKGLRVVLRPHPSFLVNAEPALSEILARFSGHPRFSLESSADVGRAFFEADVMISDYSGIALEYAAVRRRPVVFVELPPKVLNPRWAELGLPAVEVSLRQQLGKVVPAEAAQIASAADALCRGDVRNDRLIGAVVDEYLYRVDSVAAEAVKAVQTLLEEV